MRYVVTITDTQSVGMKNREIVVDADSEPDAYKLALEQIAPDEFIRATRPETTPA